MPKFVYTAQDSAGNVRKGKIEAATPTAVRNALAGQELQVQKIKEAKSILSIEIGKARVPKQELMLLSRQLAAFIRAGVPILDGIEVIAEEAGNTTLRASLFEIAEDLRSGVVLSQAFRKHDSIFPRFYTDMLKSAELTGQLDTVLDQLAGYIERDVDARQKIRSALAYPIIIFVLALVTVTVMTVFVVPRFQSFFKSLDAKLPLATRILIRMTDFLTTWWWALAGGFLIAALLVYLAIKTKRGKRALDRLLLRLPVIGGIIRFSIVERICRILSAMINAGVPLPEAMQVVTEGTGNSVFEKGLSDVRQAMLQGEGLSQPLAATKLFPSTVVQMVRVGEDTGTLDEQLATAASFYEQELGYKIKRMTTLFEPAVLVAVGLMVGFVAVAVVSAMYGIFGQIGKV